MAQKTLTTSYLALLSVANHDGVSQQICDRLMGFITDNQMLITTRQGVVTTRQGEDVAFKHYSGKDFASDDLKKEDELEDKYMSTIRALLNALLYLPENEPIRRKAEQAVQLYKDFNFRVGDGFEAEARKTVNMAQQWQAATDYTLAELGIEQWVQKAVAQANKVLQLVTVRVDHESAKVKGELANARKATDEAIRKAYDVINALMVLAPSAELSALVNVLLTIEDRAKQYYINSGKPSGGSSSSSDGSSSGSSSSGNSNNGGSSNSGNGGTTDSGNTGTTEPGGSGTGSITPVDNTGGGTEQGGGTGTDTPENPGGNSGGTGSITPTNPGDDNGGGDDSGGGDNPGGGGGGTGNIDMN